MKLKVINSNSQGNCYILDNQNSALLIECGVKIDQIKKALDYNIAKVDACLITHEHKDHSMSIKQVQGHGIPTIASKGTYDALNISEDCRDYVLSSGETKILKDWRIRAFDTCHDVTEPLGFIIEHPECGPILFATDTYKIKYHFKPFQFETIIIEANYCEEILSQITQRKGFDIVNSRRLRSHMSYQTAALTLSKMDLTRCRNIVLIHLSDGLTHEIDFKENLQALFGITVTIATPGIELEISKLF